MADGKTALVSGGNKGIGKEVVRGLAQAGHRVYLGARDPQRGQEAAAELVKAGLDVSFVQLDITRQTSIEAAAAHLGKDAECLDVLINNAGIGLEMAPPSACDVDKMREMFETNYFGHVAVTQAVLPLMAASRHKAIVNVSSGLGSMTLHGVPEWTYAEVNVLAYNSSKAALNAFSVLLAKELRPRGFSVNSVNPGYVATDLNHHQGKGTAAEGARVVIQCALRPAGSITGAFVTADGFLPW